MSFHKAHTGYDASKIVGFVLGIVFFILFPINPIGLPPKAIVFGSGYVPMSKMIRAGIILNILGVIIITLIVYFFVLPTCGASIEIPIWAH